MPVWDAFLSERDRRIFGSAGYGQRAGFGQRPVVLVIDVNYNFVGDRPEPIEESVKRWRNSCGEEGWAAVESIRRLTEAARQQRIQRDEHRVRVAQHAARMRCGGGRRDWQLRAGYGVRCC